MAKLGSFTVAKKAIAAAQEPDQEPEFDTFDFEGEEFRITDDEPPLVPLMELADAYASTSDDAFSMEALAATWQMIKYCIHEDDFPRFRGLAMRKKAKLNDLLPVMHLLWEAVANRPTQGPSGSPDGPSTTSTSSKDASPSPTGQPSTFRVDLPTEQPSAPAVAHLTPANEWAPPPTMPQTPVRLTAVDDLVA